LQRAFEEGFAQSCYSVSPRVSGECLVSSGKNVISSPSQDEISYYAISTSHGAQSTLDLAGHGPKRQYKAKTQYRLVYAEVGYALRDAQSIDKAFKAISDVLTGDKMSPFAQYCVR